MIIFVSRLDKVEFFWLFLLRWNIHPAEASQHEQILLGNHRIVTEASEDAATCVNLPFCTNKLYRNVCVCMCLCLCVSVSLSVCVCQQLQSLTFTTWPDLHPTHLANLVHTHTHINSNAHVQVHLGLRTFLKANEPASSTKFLILMSGLEFHNLIKFRRIAG